MSPSCQENDICGITEVDTRSERGRKFEEAINIAVKPANSHATSDFQVETATSIFDCVIVADPWQKCMHSLCTHLLSYYLILTHSHWLSKYCVEI